MLLSNQKTIASLLLSFSLAFSANAGTIYSGQFTDDYIGAGSPYDSLDGSEHYAGNNFEVYSLSVTKEDNWLDVSINTNFANYNSKRFYGDLFIMNGDDYQAPSNNGKYDRTEKRWINNGTTVVNGSPNRWQYAFDLQTSLGGSRSKTGYFDNEIGALRTIDTSLSQSDYQKQFVMAEDYNGDIGGAGRSGQAILVRDSKTTLGKQGFWGVSNKYLNFKINISDTPLMNATSLAFRWTQTCANDIIEGSTKLVAKTFTKVPEPNSVLIMLMALSAFSVYRKRTNK